MTRLQFSLLLIASLICSTACGCGGWETPEEMAAAEEFNAGAEPRRVAESAVREALRYPDEAIFSRYGIATESKWDEAHGGWNVFGIVKAKNGLGDVSDYIWQTVLVPDASHWRMLFLYVGDELLYIDKAAIVPNSPEAQQLSLTFESLAAPPSLTEAHTGSTGTPKSDESAAASLSDRSREAGLELGRARQLLAQGRTGLYPAKPMLRRIVEKYPETSAAHEAFELHKQSMVTK